MSRCSICLSPELPAIESALASGAFKKDVAAKFGVSAFALSRHVRHSAPAPETGTSTEEIEKWLRRADEIWERATVDADVRGQASAIAAGLRALEQKFQSEQRAAEAEPPEENDELTVHDIDCIVAKFAKVEQAAIDRTNRVAVTESQRLGWFDLADVFFACAGDADLRQAMLDFGQERIAATKEKKRDEPVSQIAN
jgi:hypothetical protein